MPMEPIFLEKQTEVAEEEIDKLEQLLKTKIDLKTGYAEPHTLARTMHHALRALDLSDDGRLDKKSFHSVMMKMNCGHDRATVRALFERHDVRNAGSIDMKDFSDALFGLKKVAASYPECRDVIKIVRQQLLSRGENGYRGLVRILRRMDDDGNKRLNKLELQEGLMTYGVKLNSDEMKTLMHFFDRDGDGQITVTEFIVGLRPTMSEARLALIHLAFLRLDKNPDGVVTMKELMSLYQADKHPAVLAGEKTVEEVFKEFSSAWDKNGDCEITEKEFAEYYRDISATIDNDTYFELMIRNAWHISGGKGSGANTSNLRVLVTHLDGTATVETVENDLGLDATDKDAIKGALRKQGVTDILKVQTD